MDQASEARPPAENLPRRVKAVFGFGSMAFGIQLQFGGLLLLFYNQVIGLPAAAVSWALGIALLFDAFWDPMVGQVSDRLRTRWGRRHPIMYFSALPLAAGFLALWNPPSGWPVASLLTYLLVAIIAARLTASFYEVPSVALLPELAPNYHDRTVLLSYRWMFGTLGAAITAVLSFGWFLRSTPEFPTGQLNRAGYEPLSWALAALIVISILVSAAGTHHRIPQLYKPTGRDAGLVETMRYMVATLRNRNFGVAVVAGMLGGLGTGLTGGLSIYFSTFFWELPARNILILILSGLAATPVAAALAPVVSRRWGKRNCCMTLFFASVVTAAGPFVLALAGAFPPQGSATLVVLLTVFAFFTGVFGTSGYILVTSMLADIVEETQLKTGRRSEGLLLSADSLIAKVVTAFGTILPGLLLGFVGFPEKAQPGQVPTATLENLVIGYVVLTVVLNTLSIWVWKFYRIDQAAHERHLTKIAEAQALAASALTSEGAPSPLIAPAPPA